MINTAGCAPTAGLAAAFATGFAAMLAWLPFNLNTRVG